MNYYYYEINPDPGADGQADMRARHVWVYPLRCLISTFLHMHVVFHRHFLYRSENVSNRCSRIAFPLWPTSLTCSHWHTHTDIIFLKKEPLNINKYLMKISRWCNGLDGKGVADTVVATVAYAIAWPLSPNRTICGRRVNLMPCFDHAYHVYDIV